MFPRANSTGGLIFLTFFALFWTFLTLTFTSMAVRSLVLQWQSTRYPTVEGRFVSSQVNSSQGYASTGSPPPKAGLLYEYEVGQTRYQSRRVRDEWMDSSSSEWARRAVSAYPQGAACTVYYNPADPAWALLVPGVTGRDVLPLMLLTPFNGAALAMWISLVASALARMRPVAPAGGVKWRQERGRIVVRLSPSSPLAEAFFVFCLGSAIAAFLFFVRVAGFDPSLAAVLVVWGAVALGSVALFALRRNRSRSGANDLIIDRGYATLSLPLTHGRAERDAISFRDVKSVEVREGTKRGRKGRIIQSWEVWLRRGGEGEEKLHQFIDKQSATDFAQWLREQINV